MDSDEVVEIHEIKTESISSDDETMNKAETVTSSHFGLGTEIEAEDDSTQFMVFERKVCHSPLDSCFSGDSSTCSPRPSDLPMNETILSLIDTPNSTPCSSPVVCTDDIKQEPDSEICEIMIPDQIEMKADECVVKMEDVPAKPIQINDDMPSTSQSKTSCVVPTMKSRSKDNCVPLKRQCSDNVVTDERAKRRKTTEESQMKGNSLFQKYSIKSV